MFLFLEEDDIVLLDRVTAIVRGRGETAILMRDNTVLATGFTPLTLQKRSDRIWKRITHTNPSRKEPNQACRKKSPKAG